MTSSLASFFICFFANKKMQCALDNFSLIRQLTFLPFSRSSLLFSISSSSNLVGHNITEKRCQLERKGEFEIESWCCWQQEITFLDTLHFVCYLLMTHLKKKVTIISSSVNKNQQTIQFYSAYICRAYYIRMSYLITFFLREHINQFR